MLRGLRRGNRGPGLYQVPWQASWPEARSAKKSGDLIERVRFARTLRWRAGGRWIRTSGSARQVDVGSVVNRSASRATSMAESCRGWARPWFRAVAPACSRRRPRRQSVANMHQPRAVLSCCERQRPMLNCVETFSESNTCAL